MLRVDGNSGTGNLLNDAIAWGTSIGSSAAPAWTANTFYWLRETTNGSSITASIWPADGVTPEKDAMTATWSQSGANARSGLAGLVADSSDGSGTFAVNYLLIQASGLPLIHVVPEPSSCILCGLGGVGLLVAARRRKA